MTAVVIDDGDLFEMRRTLLLLRSCLLRPEPLTGEQVEAALDSLHVTLTCAIEAAAPVLPMPSGSCPYPDCPSTAP
jgi:hypothetical protein